MPSWSFLAAFWSFLRKTIWRNMTRLWELAQAPDQQPAMPQLTSNTKPAPQSDMDVITNVFALIIGIDKYMNTDHFATLQGAVNDATAFYEFLVDSREQRGLGVPESNILFLKDEDATRDKILSTFESHLLTNPRIPNHGDASMILFFAGHGTRVHAPGNLMSQDEMVEGICPVDERTSPGGKYVHTIPDYVLVHLLRELSEKKGQNITVIFDSCHSGGMGRDVGQVRTAKIDASALPPELDSHLWLNKRPPPALWATSATTHVWLAACAANESAREIVFAEPQRQVVRGRFTKSLIEHLRKVDLENTTYMELLDHLPAWSGQTPFCGGDRRNQLLFDKKYPQTGRSAISLTAMDDDVAYGQTWRVSVGALAGVVPGTEFSMLDRDNHAVCTLVAQTVKVAETILILKDGESPAVLIPGNVRAVLSDWKNDEMIMRVYVSEGFPHIATLFPTECLRLQQGFVQAPSRQDAQIALRIPEDDADTVVVERFTTIILECEAEARFPLSPLTTALQWSAALNGIAHFNYFLERRHGSAPLNGVSLEVYRLVGDFPTRKPDRSVGRNGNLVIDNRALFKSEYGAKYGISIRNASSYELFPYLFAFDPTNYTIVCLYSPHTCNTRDPPLRSVQGDVQGEVTIGMGGQRALDFTLPKGVRKSSAFLKLFVATEAIGIDWIQQKISPFVSGFEGRPRLTIETEKLPDIWDAFTVTLTMTR
ncbi:ICE-like protease (Caspase) p20 domain protein [Mycena sanguinolenta]|uniref:ICE-like protease (Caspase) p20 domain protein n=1 Tax=Mycena sanguinolenta TaxID=230812 RepID=A0A8H6YXF2_9AGAR|nr:ICE-like protease (Caspase) p20 domain protein [Mycena sanguinolenta]